MATFQLFFQSGLAKDLSAPLYCSDYNNGIIHYLVQALSDEKWRPFNCFLQSGLAKDLSAPLYCSDYDNGVIHYLVQVFYIHT